MDKKTANKYLDWEPAYSPDMTKIIYASAREGDWDLYMRDVDGANEQRLTTDPAEDRTPVWSPDGKKIVFASNRDGNFEIYIMTLGEEPVRVTHNIGEDREPTWSPDGSKIAFASSRNLKRNIYIMDADGKNEKQLTSSDLGSFHPSFSVDSEHIAFVQGGYTEGKSGTFEVFTMHRDGTGLKQITRSNAHNWDPCFSLDGKRIAFSSERGGNWDIYVVDADGKNEIRLTDDEGIDQFPAFSEASNILFASNRNSYWELYEVDAGGPKLTVKPFKPKS